MITRREILTSDGRFRFHACRERIPLRGLGPTGLRPPDRIPCEGREAGMRRIDAFDWNLRDGSLSRQERIERLDRIANLLDTAVSIPGTRIRFGFDALIGLVPGIGDALTTALSLWIVYEAHQIGVPRRLLTRMLANVALDGVVGAIPLAGDAFDVMWRANRRNVRLLREHVARADAPHALHRS
jgi:hypothetical protein